MEEAAATPGKPKSSQVLFAFCSGFLFLMGSFSSLSLSLSRLRCRGLPVCSEKRNAQKGSQRPFDNPPAFRAVGHLRPAWKPKDSLDSCDLGPGARGSVGFGLGIEMMKPSS